VGGEEREERGTLITALLLLLLLPKWYLALGWRADLLRTLSFTTPPSTRL